MQVSFLLNSLSVPPKAHQHTYTTTRSQLQAAHPNLSVDSKLTTTNTDVDQDTDMHKHTGSMKSDVLCRRQRRNFTLLLQQTRHLLWSSLRGIADPIHINKGITDYRPARRHCCIQINKGITKQGHHRLSTSLESIAINKRSQK
jgi:hypothetical protein